MNEAAPLSLRTLLFGTFAAIVAFCFFEHTAWLVLAVCVLIGYCGRAYVHQSQPEIAQMQMHDMVDHTPLHSQSSDTGSNSTGMVKEGSSVDKSQRLGAPAQSGSVGIPSERPQDTAVARMPSGNTSSEQLLKGSTRAKAAPDTQMPDPDFTFPAISPLQPMQHMDPMQEQPPASQGSSYTFQAPQSTAPQVNHPGVQTISQTMTSQVSNSSESFARSSGNQPPVHQYQASGVQQQGWSSEVGDGTSMASEGGGSKFVYGRPEPTASQVPLLPDGFSLSSEGRQS